MRKHHVTQFVVTMALALAFSVTGAFASSGGMLRGQTAASENETSLGDSLATLILQARLQISEAYVYDKYDSNSPQLTDSMQLYSNSPSKSEGQDMTLLIDGDINTFWVSGWDNNDEKAPHYIRFYKSDGFPEAVTFKMTPRQGSNCNLPTKILVSISNDAKTWLDVDTVNHAELGLPTAQQEDSYTYDFSGTGGCKYIKLTVFATSANYAPYGYVCFDYSEFQIYPGTSLSSIAPISDSDVASAVTALRSAITTAEAIAPDAVTEADIATLNTAYENLVNVFDYRPRLTNLLNLCGFDDYDIGTNPGYVKEDVYTRYFNAYEQAQNILESSTATKDEVKAMYEELLAAKTAIEDDANTNPVTDGLYYIYSAYTGFTDRGKTNYAWQSLYSGNYPGWSELVDGDAKFVWEFKQLESGNYSIMNYYTKTYINHQDAIDTNDSKLNTSTTQQTEQELKFANHAGQFLIHSKGQSRWYNAQGNSSGSGTSGVIAAWTTATAGGEGAWYIVPLTDEQKAVLETQKNRNELSAYIATTGDTSTSAVAGTNPGYAGSQQVIDDAHTAYEEAVMIAAETDTYTEDDCKAAYEKLVAANEALANSAVPVTDGYYRIYTAYTYYYYNEPPRYAWNAYDDNVLETGVTGPGWERVDLKSTSFIWKITQLPSGNYTFQNLSNGKYVDKAIKSNVSYSLIQFSDEPATEQIFGAIGLNGQMFIHNTVDTVRYYDIANHGSGTGYRDNIELYSSYSSHSGCSWYMERVSDEEVAQLVADSAQNNRNAAYAKLLKKSQRAYKNNTVYNADMSNPLITSGDQLYSNNSSVNEGQHLEYMIDNDLTTFWGSAWDTESEDASHYLQAYYADGLPDSVQIYYIMRQDASWHRCPTRLMISASNDAETWEEVDFLTAADDNLPSVTLSSEPYTYTLTTAGGYKYLKLTVLANRSQSNAVAAKNYHPYFEFSEFNLYPISGSDAELSLTSQQNYVAAARELQAAITEAVGIAAGNAVTDAQIATLQEAYDNFMQASCSDSAYNHAKMNLQNLTAGDAVGEFSEADLQAYEAVVTPILTAMESTENRPTAAQNIEYGKQLIAAYEELLPKMNKPEAGKWYNITMASQETGTLSDAEVDLYGVKMRAGGRMGNADKSNSFYSYLLTDFNNKGNWDESEFSAFRFVDNGDGTYYLQCAGTGYYNGPTTGSGNSTYDNRVLQWAEPRPVKLHPCGGGQIAIQNSDDGKFIEGYPSWLNYGLAYTDMGGDTDMYESHFAWNLEPAGDFVYSVSIKQGRVISMTKPYDLDGFPTADYGEVQAYQIVGKITQEGSADSIITGYKLQKYELEDGIIPAGTPVVYIIDGEYDTNVKYTMTLVPKMNGNVVDKPDTINGHAGNLDKSTTFCDHIGYFEGDTITDEPKGTTIGAHRGTVLPWLVKDIEGATVDKIIYCGSAGMLNEISEVRIENAKTVVNVYTTDGVLVRRNVARDKATTGLAKGIYIIDKEKVLVK